MTNFMVYLGGANILLPTMSANSSRRDGCLFAQEVSIVWMSVHIFDEINVGKMAQMKSQLQLH